MLFFLLIVVRISRRRSQTHMGFSNSSHGGTKYVFPIRISLLAGQARCAVQLQNYQSLDCPLLTMIETCLATNTDSIIRIMAKRAFAVVPRSLHPLNDREAFSAGEASSDSDASSCSLFCALVTSGCCAVQCHPSLLSRGV